MQIPFSAGLIATNLLQIDGLCTYHFLIAQHCDFRPSYLQWKIQAWTTITAQINLQFLCRAFCQTLFLQTGPTDPAVHNDIIPFFRIPHLQTLTSSPSTIFLDQQIQSGIVLERTCNLSGETQTSGGYHIRCPCFFVTSGHHLLSGVHISFFQIHCQFIGNSILPEIHRYDLRGIICHQTVFFPQTRLHLLADPGNDLTLQPGHLAV